MTDKGVYISGPMTGYPSKNKVAFDAAESYLREIGAENIVNPAGKPTEIFEREATASEYRDYMKEDIFDILFGVWWFPYWLKRMLVRCGGVAKIVLLPGWAQSKGARCEVQIGKFFGLEIIPIAEMYTKGTDELLAYTVEGIGNNLRDSWVSAATAGLQHAKKMRKRPKRKIIRRKKRTSFGA